MQACVMFNMQTVIGKVKLGSSFRIIADSLAPDHTKQLPSFTVLITSKKGAELCSINYVRARSSRVLLSLLQPFFDLPSIDSTSYYLLYIISQQELNKRFLTSPL